LLARGKRKRKGKHFIAKRLKATSGTRKKKPIKTFRGASSGVFGERGERARKGRESFF